jgi:hypothetical protein
MAENEPTGRPARRPQDVANGAGEIARGILRMGIIYPVCVALRPDDGERLEQVYGRHGKFTDLPLPSGQVVRTVTLSNVEFRWPKRDHR